MKKGLSYDRMSFGGVNKGSSPVQSSAVSTSSNSGQKNEKCTEGTRCVLSTCSRLSAGGNPKDGGVFKDPSQGIDSAQNISSKSDVSSEIEQSIQQENTESIDGNWLDDNRDKLKPIMQARLHKHLKTESSSSNSPHVLPASSNDSCQQTSLDAKSGKYGTSSYTDVRCSQDELALRNAVLDKATQIAYKDGLDDTAFSPGKHSVVRTPEIVLHVQESGCDNGPKKMAEYTPKVKPGALKKIDFREYSQDGADPYFDIDEALDVATTIAREVEQEVVSCRDTSRNSYSIEDRSNQITHVSSFSNGLSDTKRRIQSPCERGECGRVCSSKDAVDPEISTSHEQLLSEDDKLIDIMAPKLVDSDHCHNQDSSSMAEAPKDLPSKTAEIEEFANNGQASRSSIIDLNEDIPADNVESNELIMTESMPNHAKILSKPTPVMAKPGIPISLPKPNLQSNGKLCGWRGASATSVFKSYSRPKHCDGNKVVPNSEVSRSPEQSKGKRIDLNITAGNDSDVEILPGKCVTAPLSFPSEGSSLGSVSTHTKRFTIDLNTVDEDDDSSGPMHAPAPTRQPYRNFDLNDIPPSTDLRTYQDMPAQGNRQTADRMSDDYAMLMRNARSSNSNHGSLAFLPDISNWQGHNNLEVAKSLPAPAGVPPPAQMQRVMPVQNRLPSSSQLQHLPFYHSSGYFVNPTRPLNVYAHGLVQYAANPQGNFIPHLMGSSARPSFPGAVQNSMEAAGGYGPHGIAITRPSVDPNNGIIAENGNRERFTRQLMPLSNTSTAEPTNSTQQASLMAVPVKRREPDGGWDTRQIGNRQFTRFQ